MAKRPIAFWDIECYPNYFLVKFMIDATGQQVSFPMFQGTQLNVVGIRIMLAMYTIIGFNTKNYDEPMLSYALAGADNASLKKANDAIIIGKLKPWTFFDTFNCELPAGLDSIDLQEPAPGVKISLKIYGGRANSRRMQDLPYEHNSVLGPFEMINVDKYCGNDLFTTRDLYYDIKDRIELRDSLSEQYGIDLRSKSDAQIAEAVIKSQLGFYPDRRHVEHGYQFHYQKPHFVEFVSPQFNAVLQTVLNNAFTCSDADQVTEELEDAQGKKIKTGVIIPKAIKDIRVRLGCSVYKFGIGGLHSQESNVAHFTVPGVNVLSDHDVTSYYPSMILLLGMFPAQLGPRFLEIYRSIYDTRLDAKANQSKCKKAGDKEGEKHWKTIAEGLKIVLNGTFGKLGSKYSILFSPEQLIQVTITGQLLLLMLIEQMEHAGISVISANTDGIVLSTPCGMEIKRDAIIKHWENITGLGTEATFYSAIFNRDVNNYIAFKWNDAPKTKGVFGSPGVKQNKTPHRSICAKAVTAYLRYGVPLEKTIRDCTDMREFTTVRNVTGGAIKRSEHPMVGTALEPFESAPDIQLGKAVRWYYGKNEKGCIYTKLKGSKVADSDGAVPMMEMLDSPPADLDYDYYIRHANAILKEIGL